MAALVRRIAFLLLLVVAAACSGTGSPVASAPTPAATAVPEKTPCEVAAELRGRVPRLMKEGKLHRTGRVIEKANQLENAFGLCRSTEKVTWAAAVEVAALLGRWAEARRLVAVIGTAAEAKVAAKAAAERVERFDRDWPKPEAVTPEMRKAYEVAEQAAAEGRLEEAIGLYEKAWEAWPLNGQALLSAGFVARKVPGRAAGGQRFFDRAVAVLEGRTGKAITAEVPNGFNDEVGVFADLGIVRAESGSESLLDPVDVLQSGTSPCPRDPTARASAGGPTPALPPDGPGCAASPLRGRRGRPGGELQGGGAGLPAGAPGGEEGAEAEGRVSAGWTGEPWGRPSPVAHLHAMR